MGEGGHSSLDGSVSRLKLEPEEMHNLVSRLYTPELLLSRTLAEKHRRMQESDKQYSHVKDPHLRDYWHRRRLREAHPRPSSRTGTAFRTPCSGPLNALQPADRSHNTSMVLGDGSVNGRGKALPPIRNVPEALIPSSSMASGTPSRRSKAELSPHSPGVEEVRKKDLTAISILINPPAHFMAPVHRLRIDLSDYDLKWLLSTPPDRAYEKAVLNLDTLPTTQADTQAWEALRQNASHSKERNDAASMPSTFEEAGDEQRSRGSASKRKCTRKTRLKSETSLQSERSASTSSSSKTEPTSSCAVSGTGENGADEQTDRTSCSRSESSFTSGGVSDMSPKSRKSDGKHGRYLKPESPAKPKGKTRSKKSVDDGDSGYTSGASRGSGSQRRRTRKSKKGRKRRRAKPAERPVEKVHVEGAEESENARKGKKGGACVPARVLVTSPRSALCCLRVGVRPCDLLPKSVGYFRRQVGLEGAPSHVIQRRHQHSEEQRLQQLAALRAAYHGMKQKIGLPQFISLMRAFEHDMDPACADNLDISRLVDRNSNSPSVEQPNTALISRPSTPDVSLALSLQASSQQRAPAASKDDKQLAFRERCQTSLEKTRQKLQGHMVRSILLKKKRKKEWEERQEKERERLLNFAEEKRRRHQERQQNARGRAELCKEVLEESRQLAEGKRTELIHKQTEADARREAVAREARRRREIAREDTSLRVKEKRDGIDRRRNADEWTKLVILDRIRRRHDKVTHAAQFLQDALSETKYAREQLLRESELVQKALAHHGL
ncbi:hypothetical protein DIPPA_13964 [Diplonema papillatum]|nr:hypothetical protein DIPPA_13964 [Diplonema papillatum]